MKILSLMRLNDQEDRLIKEFPEHHFEFYKHPKEVVEDHLKDVDVLISYHSQVDESFLEKCNSLKLIAWYATGVNNLPLQYIEKNNIKLTNAKGVHAIQIAEFIFGYILNDVKLFKETYNAQLNKEYKHKLTPDSIYKKTVTFLGTGEIPKRTAKIAKAFDMHVVGINTTGHEVNDDFDEIYDIDNRKEAFKKADFVVNVLPETKRTSYLLNVKDFQNMKPSAHFINVGRGTVISEEDLIEVLNKDLIRKISLDVYEKEPLNPNSKLYDFSNVTLTPHITGNDENNYERCTDILIENLKNLNKKNNKQLINQVNLKVGY